MLDKNAKLLLVENISKKYANGFTAVDNVCFSMESGECLGLVGESGSGKSSLAKCILMIEKTSSGKIYFQNEDLQKLSEKQLQKKRLHMQAVFQNPASSLNPKIKIIDSLMEPLDNQPEVCPSFLKGIRNHREKIANLLLEMVNISKDTLYTYPSMLSGGQKQRILIARAISIQPSLIVFDEPTASLDVSTQGKILNLLKDLKEDLGLSYFFISHDLSAVNFMCDRLLVMKNGELIDKFSKEDLFSHERHEYTKQLLNIFSC